MGEQAGVTAEELVQSLRRRKAALPSEIGTFVALEVCEAMCRRGAALARSGDVVVSMEGDVTLSAAAAAADDEAQAARAVHKLFTELLLVSGPSLSPGLLRLVELPEEDGFDWTLSALRDRLEAALVPLNRTAARRVLSRLLREMERGGGPSFRAPQAPSLEHLDDELGALLGEAPAPPRPALPADPSSDRRDPTEREPVAEVGSGELRAPAHPQQASKERAAEDVSGPGAAIADDLPPMDTPGAPGLLGSDVDEAAPRRPAEAEEAEDALSTALRDVPAPLLSEPPGRGRGLWVGLGLVALAVVLAVVIALVRPDAVARLRGEVPDAPAAKPPPRPAQVSGDLTVHVEPARSQVLRFVGRGPTTIRNLPLGVAHELVAVAEGATPSRVVIPSDAEWEDQDGRLRYEVAIQTGPPLADRGELDLGDSLLPRDVGTPTSTLGDVRVVTTPRGAKVYQLIGFAPEVRVRNLPVDKVLELLVYHPGMEPVVKVVSPSDWTGDGPRKAALLDVKLRPKRR